jgi:hypothetical protein
MNTPESLREFTSELIRRGLPVEYSRRAAEELGDHLRDLTEEFQSAGMEETVAHTAAVERLGDRQSLVKKTVREFQRRHWCGRWPVVTFLFGPLVLLVATWIVTGVGLMLLGKTLDAVGIESQPNDGIHSTAERIAMSCFTGWFVFVLPTVVLLLQSRWASQAGLNWRWVALAAIVLAVNVGSMQCGNVCQLSGSNVSNLATDQPLPPNTFVMSVPLWIYFSGFQGTLSWYANSPQQLCQSFLPLAVAGLMIWRTRRRAYGWEENFAFAC